MDNKLKPCPFCKEKWFPVDDDGNYVLAHDQDCFFTYVGLQIQRVFIENETYVYIWNTRAEPAYLAGYKDGLAVGKCEERTCRGCVENDNRENSDECAWCNRNPMYEDNFELMAVR